MTPILEVILTEDDLVELILLLGPQAAIHVHRALEQDPDLQLGLFSAIDNHIALHCGDTKRHATNAYQRFEHVARLLF